MADNSWNHFTEDFLSHLKNTRQLSEHTVSGYQRELSGRGEVAIDGERCPVVGRVSMDLVTIDVSRLSRHRVGNWVEIMGPTISIDTLATKANTIGYEFLTRLGSRMERTIV